MGRPSTGDDPVVAMNGSLQGNEPIGKARTVVVDPFDVHLESISVAEAGF